MADIPYYLSPLGAVDLATPNLESPDYDGCLASRPAFYLGAGWEQT